MNSEEAESWIDGFQSFGMRLGLDRIILLMDHLGNPQQHYNSIHIGGTNGKGSVCHLISSILQESGYRCGLYTSPHLQHLFERFIVDGSPISSSEFVDITTRVKTAVDMLINQGIQPTYFEVCTAIALVFFRERKVEYAVIEVGLGGQFDATNIITPVLSVITNVSLEHQQVLGRTIRDIAHEKAGIIKHHIPVITAATAHALDVLETEAERKQAPLQHIISDNITVQSHDLSGQHLLITGQFQQYQVKTSMIGSYQQENIALAIAAVESLQMNGAYIPEEAIVNGIEKTMVPGRLEKLQQYPLVLVDGAHTIEAMRSVQETFESLVPQSRIIVVFGLLNDKKVKEITRLVSKLADIIIITKSTSNRALDPSKIMRYFDKSKQQCLQTSSVEEGIKKALTLVTEDDVILITGSLTIVGDAKTYFTSK